ncbi:helix-turn-helix domain-containing protein [Muricauda sp. CAU 1633]|uniref:helix-turn-helix domain-containing protein n=1 Tax=Allomuricauda sp. CAU 1633 TaxID=2816036 RepID=UPI001A8DFD09|nr:helix-turn-helix domain-containing protein [Muricauda sp. CAU 1633]MBO0322517.1 helix-turn-helix domain-containing protein [Muricauda sp. CAU 1633]
MKKFSKPLVESLNLAFEMLTILYSVYLIFLIFFKIIKYEKASRTYNARKIRISTRWIKITLLFGLLACLLWVIVSFNLFYKGRSVVSMFYLLWIAISIIIYWVGYKGVIELKILKQREDLRKHKSEFIQNVRILKSDATSKTKILFDKIIDAIMVEQLFLDSNLSLNTLAEKNNISAGYLSQLFGTYLKESFTDYINQLRIEAFKKMLDNKEYRQYTIEAIALESGFNSKSNFYTVFKKLTSMTPSDYKKVQNFKDS